MAIGLAAVFMLATLRRRNNETARLDRTRAQQHMPVRLARHSREGSRHGEYLRPGLCQRAIKRREAQVIADRHAHTADAGIGKRY